MQWSNDAFIIVDYCQYCRFKKTTGFIFFSLNDNTDNGRQFFLCNGVMMLLLLLTIVNIVVLKKQLALYFLVLTTIQTMVDNFFCAME